MSEQSLAVDLAGSTPYGQSHIVHLLPDGQSEFWDGNVAKCITAAMSRSQQGIPVRTLAMEDTCVGRRTLDGFRRANLIVR